MRNLLLMALAFVLLAGTLSAQIPSYVPTNGLAGWWSFNGNANDESGNGNNGTTSGLSFSADRFGNPNGSLSLNGVNNFSTLSNAFFGGGQVPSFTMHCVVKANSTANRPNIWGKTFFWGEINLEVDSNNKIVCFWANSFSGNKYSTITSNNGLFQVGLWNTIDIVYQNSVGQIYLNGVLISTNLSWSSQGGSLLSTTQIESVCNFATDANSSRFGVRSTGGVWGNYFNGLIDEFGIWNRALTQLEITNLYNSNSTPPCSSLPSNLTNGLVGYWPFCGNANDESGNGNNGTVYGAALTNDRFGNPNRAYTFNGSSDYIDLYSNTNILNTMNGLQQFTLSYWAFIPTNSTGCIWGHWSNNNGQVGVNCGLSAGFVSGTGFRVGNYSGCCDFVQTSFNAFNAWSHVVVVFDSTQLINSDIIKTYVNGQIISYSQGGIANTPLGNGTSLFIGRRNVDFNNFGDYFLGKVDDIGIWNRALTQQEITNLYSSNLTPPCASLPSNLSSGLVGYWPFCGNANDESGNGNNGTTNGTTLTQDRFGNLNSAYNFNGVSAFISIGDPIDGSLDFLGGDYSISVWLKTIENDAPIITKQNPFIPNNNGDYNIDIAQGQGRKAVGFGSGTGAARHSSISVNNNNWHHLVAIYTSTSIDVYIDGVLSNGLNTNIGSHPSVLSNSNQPLLFGKGFNNELFQGLLDDIGMWNRALTPQEVFELYSDPASCTTPYFSDLDNDGYGGLLLGNFCSAPPNGVLQGGDCDDANSSIHPGVAEICNGVDDDCDGIVDNGSIPAIGPILGNYQSCIPLAAGNRTFSVVPVAGVNNYAWSLPVGMNLVSGQGTPTINVSWTSSTAHTGILGNLSVVPSMDCFTGNAVSVVADLNISVPVTPPSISGASRVCVDDVITYSISSVARARQYNWTLPTGMTLLSGQGSNVISAVVDSSFTGGLLNVSGVNTCGGSPLRSKTISYNIPNTPAVIFGQTQGICDLTSVIFTTAGSFGSLGYNWIVPTGITILNGQGSNSIEVSVSNNFTNGILRVVANNNCGISNQRTISLSGNPGIPSIISGPINICPGSTNNAYTVQTATGATYYTWTVPASATITSGSSTKNILVDYSSVAFSNQSITVRAGNLCGESPIRNLTGISGNISFCNRVSNGNDKSELSIYPNPANQILYLSANGDTPQNIEIYNLLGVRVKNQESGNEVILEDIVEGVYVLKAIVNQKVVVRRFEVVR